MGPPLLSKSKNKLMQTPGQKLPDLPQPLVLFDGACNLCNHAIRFVLKRDHHHFFHFTSLQSTFAKQLIGAHWPKNQKLPDSLLLWENGKLYSRSEAAIRIAKHLSGLWPLVVVFKIVPRFMSNGAYDFVARHRYRWFGKKDCCSLQDADKFRKFFL